MDPMDDLEPTASLRWHPELGFDLDLTAVEQDAVVRLVGVPVPADGTVQLSGGVSLHALDILFKAHVDWNGAPCQLRTASVRLAETTGGHLLVVEGEIEDPDSGDGVHFRSAVAVVVPRGAPASGGPVPQEATEDDLDWDDETTVERMLGDVDAPIHTESRRRALGPDTDGDDDDDDDGSIAPKGMESVGLKRLLEALTRGEPPKGRDDAFDEELDGDLDDDGFDDDDFGDEDGDDDDAAPAGRKVLSGPEKEALDFLNLLDTNEHIELAEGHELEELASGVAVILSGRGNAESKAARLSAWLLDQSAVDELFIDDEELSELLEQW